jgi:hypothetical protein
MFDWDNEAVRICSTQPFSKVIDKKSIKFYVTIGYGNMQVEFPLVSVFFSIFPLSCPFHLIFHRISPDLLYHLIFSL